jgi:uncharacterized protein YcbX
MVARGAGRRCADNGGLSCPVSHPQQPEPDVRARVARLFVYPVKSCAGVELGEALLAETGLDLDRSWMVVDAQGRFLTQREWPRMALVRPQIRTSEVVLRAPGMLALHLGIDGRAPLARAGVGGRGRRLGHGRRRRPVVQRLPGPAGLRLARFDPQVRRLSSLKWTGGIEAVNQFADGYPFLVTSEASLAELNRRLQAAGHAPVGIERLRPNLVLAGVEAHDEDRLAELRIATADGPVVLRPVKPCARCPIPNIDPRTARAAGAGHVEPVPRRCARGRAAELRHERHRPRRRGPHAARGRCGAGRLAVRLKLSNQ